MLPFELVGRLLPLVPNNAHLAKLLIECDLEGCKTSAFLPGQNHSDLNLSRGRNIQKKILFSLNSSCFLVILSCSPSLFPLARRTTQVLTRGDQLSIFFQFRKDFARKIKRKNRCRRIYLFNRAGAHVRRVRHAADDGQEDARHHFQSGLIIESNSNIDSTWLSSREMDESFCIF